MIRSLFLSVFEISVSTGFMILLFMMLSPLVVRRYAAKWKYWVWLFLALWLIIPVKEIGGRFLNPKTEAVSENAKDTIVDVEYTASPIMIEIPTRMTAEILSLSEESKRTVTVLDIIAVVWCLGGIAFISVHILGYLHYRKRLTRWGMSIEDEKIIGLLSELKNELDIKGGISLWKYSRAASPMLIGFFKPVIVLPKEEYSRDELFFILKHELIHYKRHDIWLKLLLVVAKGIHWFNPVVWVMQKEAVIDMEMSCDERVIKNADYVMKKAYTETLLSTIHRQYAGQTLLSTQFKGGKQIMKKRFKNILSGGKKKNGLLLFTGIAVMTMSLGMLVGCSVGEPLANKAADAIDSIPVDGETADKSDEQPEVSDVNGENDVFPEGDSSYAAPEKAILMVSKEGELQTVPVTLFAGDGYSIYIPDEGWRLSDPEDGTVSYDFTKYGLDKWASELNEQVLLWVNKYDGASVEEVREGLAEKGYQADGTEMAAGEAGLLYRVKLIESETGCYGVFYCCPEEAEEGFGRDLSAIADSFAISGSAENILKEEESKAPEEDPFKEARTLVEEFLKAYFANDTDSIKQYLADSYSGDGKGFPGDKGAVVDSIKDSMNAQNTQAGENYTGAVQFKERETDDYYQYLTIELVKEESGWKVVSYGLEM